MMSTMTCISCNNAVQKGIYNSTFYPNLLAMLSAFIVLAIIIGALARMSAIRSRQTVPLFSAALVLGIGIGGFIDGIVLHQLLQWHEMLTNKIPADTLVNKSINMFWDGVFHFFTLVTTLVGIYLLWRLSRRTDINKSGYLLSGGLLSGWGLFNLVEGVINHQILKLHNVYEYTPTPDVYNYSFLASGVALLLVGWLLRKIAKQYSI